MGEERWVVLEVGVARVGEIDRLDADDAARSAESTATRSEMNTASAIEWVTNRTVVASCSHSRASRWRMSARVISSRAANGSSISSSGAPSAIARTSETRCCIPPDSSCG